MHPPHPLPGFRELLVPSIRLFRRCLGRTFLYAFLVQILTQATIWPCLGWVYYKAIAASGRPAVTNYDMACFLMTVEGALGAILWGFVGTILFLVGAGGLIVITTAQEEGRRLTPWHAFRSVLSDGPRLAGHGLVKLVVAAAVLVPVSTKLAFCLSSLFFFPFRRDLVHEFLPDGFRARALIFLVLSGTFVGFHLLLGRWLFTLHGVFVEHRSLSRSIKRSVWMGRGHALRLLRITLSFHLISVALLTALSALLGLGSWALIRSWSGNGTTGSLGAAGAVLLVALLSLSLAPPLLASWGAALVSHLYAVMRERGAPLDPPPHFLEALGSGPEPPPRLWRRIALGGLLALALGTILVRGAERVRKARREAIPPVLVTAHRGSSGRAPENTVRSIVAAAEDRADYAEIDVTQSKDGELVVFHDANLKRVTGLNRNVWELTFRELRELDAGGRFRPEFRGEKIPTLREVLDAARGRVRMNIEIKVHGHGREHGIAEQTVSIIREAAFEDECIITSLDYQTLLQVRRLTRRIPVGLIVTAVLGDLMGLELDFYSVQPALATSEFVREAHARGRPVHVWTINAESYMEIMMDRGVDSVITNEPARARSLAQRRERRQEKEAFVARLLAR